MIEDVFLSYANIRLKGNPEGLYQIFDEVKKNIPISLDGIDFVIKTICEFSHYERFEDPSDLQRDGFGGFEGVEDYPKDIEPAPYRTLGVTATLGFRADLWLAYKRPPHKLKVDREKYIEHLRSESCRFKERFDSWECDEDVQAHDFCNESLLLKCYECYQMDFIHLMWQVVADREFSEIQNFNVFLRDASDISIQSIDYSILGSNEKAPPFGRMERRPRHIMSLSHFFHNIYGNVQDPFNTYLTSIASFSLVEFLCRNDRKKLKQCPYCHDFFVAKDIKRKNCCYSHECEKAYQRDKKRKQREGDPVTYY